ncbi:MAG TPA: hypothetical protein VMA36_16375 [Candidatus Limnocylindria bacterium]|jgi:hypothetical protein|nr:hypothetical protein [Candidatus Limnocylindria bacterium]
MTPETPYRALRILLWVLSAIETVAGVILLFASGWVVTLAGAQLNLAMGGGYVVLLLKAIGIVAIALGYLLCAAARDPLRYVAVIDTLTFVLIAAAAVNVYAVTALHVGAFYPTSYLIGRALVQIAFAVVLIALRPRNVSFEKLRMT